MTVSHKQCDDKIDEAKNEGDSIGGVVRIVVENMPVACGSYVHYDRKLDDNCTRYQHKCF